MNDKKDKKIIATKSKFMLWISLGIVIVISAIFLPIIIQNYNVPWAGLAIFFFVIPTYVILIAISVILFIIWLCHPKTLISFCGEELTFYPQGKKVKLKDIKEVSTTGFFLGFNVFLNEGKIKVSFIKKADEVAEHINFLIAETKMLSNEKTQG
ncbi:MAG: hypothetical protein FWC82_00580 [Firmicutes bacterium]|nr:hypothetical protein [Bacillota bacterium]